MPWPVNPTQGVLSVCLSPGPAGPCPAPGALCPSRKGWLPGQHGAVPFPLCLPQSFPRQLGPSLPPWALSLWIRAVCLAQPGSWLFPVWDGCPGMGLPGSPPSLSSKGLGWDFPSWREELLPKGFWKGISCFRAPLSPLPLCPAESRARETPLEWSRSSAQGHGVLGSGVSSSLSTTP